MKRKSDDRPHFPKKPRLDNQTSSNKPLAKSHKPSESDLPRPPPITRELEAVAFTHQSVIGGQQHDQGTLSYERLEFLGDAYIELFASRFIWEQFKDLPAGRLSQIRELLVKNETLGEFTEKYGFDSRINCTIDLSRTQPKVWTKIKGDVFEAYVAAIVLSDPENGARAAENWLTDLWRPKLKTVESESPNLRAKEELNKLVGGRGAKITYEEEKPMLRLNGGRQLYFMGAYLQGWGWTKRHLGSGQGSSKTEAGNYAASKALGNEAMIGEITAKRKQILDEQQAQTKESEVKSDVR